MNSFLANWKTTAGGVATVMLGVLSLLGVKVAGQAPIDPQVAMGMITGGLALIFAKDAGSSVVKILVVAFLVSMFCGPRAEAADLSGTAAINKALSSPTPCVAQSCSGWYAGFGLMGDGSNADIIGNGINGSVFSSGGALNVDAGYQLWNGSWFAAAELGVGYEFTTNSSGVAVQKGSRFIGTELMKLGYNFFPNSASAVTTPSQSPIPLTVPANLLAASTPYLAFGGLQRRGISEWVNGAGVETVIAASWVSHAEYLYAPAQQGVPATSIVRFGVDKHF